jgi:hypothetical protein
MKRKEADDVLGGEETWRDADSTTGQFLNVVYFGSEY